MKRIAIPPMLGDLIRSTILAMDGISFTDLPACPECGSPLKRHDSKEKRFAHMHIGKERRDIHVLVTRFRCRSCGGFWYATGTVLRRSPLRDSRGRSRGYPLPGPSLPSYRADPRIPRAYRGQGDHQDVRHAGAAGGPCHQSPGDPAPYLPPQPLKPCLPEAEGGSRLGGRSSRCPRSPTRTPGSAEYAAAPCPRIGMKGMKRTRKKPGIPARKSTTVRTSEAPRRTAVRTQPLVGPPPSPQMRGARPIPSPSPGRGPFPRVPGQRGRSRSLQQPCCQHRTRPRPCLQRP